VTAYAQNTSVPVERSKAEIEHTLLRYGASQFVSGWQGDAAMIGFGMHGRMIRFVLAMPPRDSKEFTTTPGGRRQRDSAAAYRAWEQACRQRWRALALVIKAKLEAVESGITSFEAEFLAATLLPGNVTVEEATRPQIEQAYKTGRVMALLPGLPAGEVER
jgi:hypothetical protein